jgi:TatD DNase family protein
MILTDTHTHLYSEAFDADRDSRIDEAIRLGVERFFIPAIDASYIPAMLDLKAKFPRNVHLMAGLHPTHVKENASQELEQVRQMIRNNEIVAVGEIGVDLYWDKTHEQLQKDVFKEQIELALQESLPIVIHCRDAFNEVFEVLEEFRSTDLKGVFHCFTGNLEQANHAIDLNLKLGIGGVVTFKNGKIDQFLRQIDLSHLVLETDAPYLAPVPYRGKRNESSYLPIVAQKVADIYELSIEEVARVTTLNSSEVFGV